MSEPRPTALVVEDEQAAARVLTVALERDGFQVETVGEASQALSRLASVNPDVVLADHLLPGLSGLDLLRYLLRRAPDLPVVLMTAHGDERLAVEAMKLGAFSYLPKPLRFEEVTLVLRRAVELRRLRREVREARIAGSAGELIGTSAAITTVRELIADVAPTQAAVLILGETGTGKELVARAIHGASGRASGPFVAINCAAIPEALLEAELFGHVRGAFTGAVRDREGKIATADRGTLFLDEIGELPPSLQPKLLRVLEEQSVTPVGANRAQRVSFRLITATHRRLEDDVQSGRFREDLYYRLNVVPLELPPLRARRSDIPLLVRHLLPRIAERHGRAVSDVDPALLEWLELRPWRGNVRELENTLERLVVTSRDQRLRLPSDGVHPSHIVPFHEEKRQAIDVFEREYLMAALQACRSHLGETARRTGISPRQLYTLLHKHGLTRDVVTDGEPETATAQR
jgi:DNA-binding NtrC family response regulator